MHSGISEGACPPEIKTEKKNVEKDVFRSITFVLSRQI